jgi:dTDP-4-amino-4,6-dideoxygalactose transaminase
MIKFFDLTKQYQDVGKEIEESVTNLLRSGKYTLGENVSKFESNFADYVGTKYCIGVASGTDALMLSLSCLPSNGRDEVITVSNTYVATVEAIIHAGFKPVFVDIDPETGLMDLSKVAEKINISTVGVIPVHLYGQCVDMDKLNMIVKSAEITNEIFVIEDACQAHGAKFNHKKAGSMGNFGCFSFYPSKNLGCAGEGGAITTDNERFYHNILSLRDHGQPEKNHHKYIGYNSRLDAIQACVLNIKLTRLDRWNDNRTKVSWIYDSLFNGTSANIDIKPLKIQSECVAVFHLYVIRTSKRDVLIEILQKEEIQFGIHYPIPIHLQPAYHYLGYKEGDFPVTEQFCKEIVSLPMYPEMSLSEIQLIGRKILYG